VNAWREEGFAVESMQAGEFRKLRATRKVDHGPGIFDAAHRANTVLRVPDWLVGYMRDAIGQSERTGDGDRRQAQSRGLPMPSRAVFTR
jgi:hypothetical protein